METTPISLSESQKAFLDAVNYAVVGTLNADGSIQQTVVWFIREGEQLRLSLGASSAKARNLRRDGRITLTVEVGMRYLTVSGQALVEPMDPELRRRLATRYLGAERAEAWLKQQPDRERVSVRISVLRAYGQGL